MPPIVGCRTTRGGPPVEANREFRGIFEENSQEIFSLMKKGLRQPGPRPVMLLGWIANGLKLWALVVFFDNPTPTGLVDAAWLYIIAQVLFFVVSGALGLTNGLRHGRFSLSRDNGVEVR